MLNYTTYILSQDSDWVTFIHGAGGSSSIWYKQLRDFKTEFNVLLIDLRGHGKSKMILKNTTYTFNLITDDIIEVIDFLKIKKSHFIGISLGSILIRNITENYPNRIQSMLLTGAIVKLNIMSYLLMILGNIFKSILPYMVLYHFFAYVIMPYKNHTKSRILFAREAKKVGKQEFINWFKLTSKLPVLLHYFRENEVDIPTLYIMGEEDHMYLHSVKKLAKKHSSAQVIVVANSGHVVNIEQPLVFNTKSIQYIKSL